MSSLEQKEKMNAVLADPDVTWESFDRLEEFMAAVFVAQGVPEEDARICAGVLITADKRGIDSHGIARMKTIYYDRIKMGVQIAKTNFDVVRDSLAVAVVDGHDGMGHYIGHRCMEMAIQKAKMYGMGMVVCRNSTHYGCAGYYALMAVKEGMIGVTGTNARPSVAPTYGVDNLLGTNPLTFGMPSDEEFPFVIDCATSTTQRGKIEMWDRVNQPCPPGVVVGSDGLTRTDTHQILKELIAGTCAFTPLGGIGEDGGGHKGYGWSTAVEILSAALQGGSFLGMLSGFDVAGKPRPYHLGHFFIAINVSSFTELENFQKTTGDILRTLRSSKRMPGHDRIWTAGEKEHDVWLERKDKGAPLTLVTQREILKMCDECALTERFSFPQFKVGK
jgi:LDH2 family malate/lactate/ureidoglycolate dehydrogenase